MNKKIFTFFTRIFVFVFYELWGYWITSQLHRKISDRKWKDTKLPIFRTLSEFGARARQYVWKKDGLDCACSPQKVEAVGFNGLSPHGNDCEDIACWHAAVASLSWFMLMMTESIVQAHVLTTLWVVHDESGNHLDGHSVCVMRKANDKWVYIDYSDPSKEFGDLDEINAEVFRTMRPQGKDSTMYMSHLMKHTTAPIHTKIIW